MTPTASPGLLGFLKDNQTQLLGLGSGLLSASGYSEQPVSLGQAFGRGIQGWQQGQQVADQRKRQSLYDQLQQKQSELAEKRVGISEQELAMRTQQAQQEAAQREAAGTAVSGLLGTPEQPTGLLSPAEAAWARANPQEYLSTRAQAEISNRNRAPSAFEQKLSAAGYQPGTPEYQAAARGLLNKPGQQININTGERENAFEKDVGKGFASQYLGLQEDANAARTSNARLIRAEQLVDSLSTGSLTPASQTVKRLAKSGGIDLQSLGITDDTGPAEALTALSTQFTLDAVSQTKGSVSDREMALFQGTAAGLSKTPEGNKLIIQMARRMNDLKIQQASLARDYYRKNGVFDEGYYNELDRFHAENPLFTKELQSKIESLQGVSRNGTRPIATDGKGNKVQWNPETASWEAM